MIVKYDIIKSNLEIYQEAKSNLPIISEYERGEVTSSVMRDTGLGKFARFYEFLKRAEISTFQPVMEDMNWRKLKLLISQNTTNERFKKFILNRTENQFISILKDPEEFDRLLNGRWIRKPGRTPRGRKTYGRRSDIRVEGLDICIIPIINYMILNNIEFFDPTNGFDSFISQDRISHFTVWYSIEELTLDGVPIREIGVTKKLLDVFVNTMEDSNIDFRKLNLEYIITAMSEKLRKSISIPNGTLIKCLKDVNDSVGRLSLVKDKLYEVKGQYIQSGYLKVYITNELGRSDYYEYSLFEDMAVHRDELLNSLFGS